MDAFSLALAYGAGGITKKDKNILSLIVGIYHFVMPLLGITIGNLFITKINFNTGIIVGIILLLIGIEMIISSFKNKKDKVLYSLYGYLLFGLSVSIDSFTVGIGLKAITNNILLASLIFAFTSFIFTFIGLNIGNYLNFKYGNISTIIGGITLMVIGITYIV